MDRGAQGATVHGVTESQTQQWLNNNNMPLHCLLPLLLRSQLLIALFPWVIFLLLLFDLSLFFHGLPWWLRTVKHLPAIGETWVGSLGREDPLEEETSTPVLLPGKLHGLRSLVGYSPWGHKELGMTEWLHFHFLSLFFHGIFREGSLCVDLTGDSLTFLDLQI